MQIFRMKIEINISSPDTGDAPKGIAAKAIDAIRSRMASEGINASGRTSASLRGEDDDTHVLIWAEGEHAPFATVQHGGGPHRNSEPLGFEEAIRRWVREKPGFVPHQREGEDLEHALDRAAGAIIHKIRREGTGRYSHPRDDIYSPALDAAVEEFKRRVRQILINSILQ